MSEIAYIRQALSRDIGEWALPLAKALRTKEGWEYFLHHYLREKKYHTASRAFDMERGMKLWYPTDERYLQQLAYKNAHLRERVDLRTGTSDVLEAGDGIAHLRFYENALIPRGIFLHPLGIPFVGMAAHVLTYPHTGGLYYVALLDHLAALAYRKEEDLILGCVHEEYRHWDLQYVTQGEYHYCRVHARSFSIPIAARLEDAQRYQCEGV